MESREFNCGILTLQGIITFHQRLLCPVFPDFTGIMSQILLVDLVLSVNLKYKQLERHNVNEF